MSDIEELERRVTAAMDRLAKGIGALDSGHAARIAELETALEEERVVNAQLKERVARLRQKHTRANAAVEKLDLEMQRLRRANEELIESNSALMGEEAEKASTDIVKQALLAELEALRAARASEAEEAQSIIGSLSALVDTALAQEKDKADA